MKAKIIKELLSDNSEVYAITISEDKTEIVKFNCVSYESAEYLLKSLETDTIDFE